MESTQRKEKRWTSEEEGPSHPLEEGQGCGSLALSLPGAWPSFGHLLPLTGWCWAVVGAWFALGAHRAVPVLCAVSG